MDIIKVGQLPYDTVDRNYVLEGECPTCGTIFRCYRFEAKPIYGDVSGYKVKSVVGYKVMCPYHNCNTEVTCKQSIVQDKLRKPHIMKK